jgi:hypothetical protein
VLARQHVRETVDRRVEGIAEEAGTASCGEVDRYKLGVK